MFQRFKQIIRLIQINLIIARYGFSPQMVGNRHQWLRWLTYLNPFRLPQRHLSRGESLRLAIEELGPIFVKFGQLLSTRRDLLPDDIANELAKLQDQVPPFSEEEAKSIITSALQQSIENLFANFTSAPLASASIAQVHAAVLHSGEKVVVKILRPRIQEIISHDIALMYLGAKCVSFFWKKTRKLKLIAFVSEFERTINDELDLRKEAANASQLRRNFANSNKMYVPKIYWNYVRPHVIVMERIYGVRISDISILNKAHTNLKKLAEHGVEIFFTQVLRDSFFHADMHPGNLFVDITDPENPKYIGVDFGIMGSLSPFDQRYIAENLYAFFKRDYRRVACLHVESGWVPPNTRIDEFESAIRAVCEPIFEKPLKEISFGQLLLNLLQTAEHFHMKIQPQLMLLQKTLLSIEGLGRTLYPDLDLWQTAQPVIERWLKRHRGVRHLWEETSEHLPKAWQAFLKTPETFLSVLGNIQIQQRWRQYNSSVEESDRSSHTQNKKIILLTLGMALISLPLIHLLISNVHLNHFSILELFGLGGLLLWIGSKKDKTR